MAWVNVLDLTTNEVTRVNPLDLGPRMMPVKCEGKEDVYWVDSKQLKQGVKYFHPPFQGELKKKIEEIQRILYGQREMSYIQWEDGFRRDKHPEKEIDLWFWAAKRFQQVVDSGLSSEAEQRDVYKIVLQLIVSGPNPAQIFPLLRKLTCDQALELMAVKVGDFSGFQSLNEGDVKNG